jgi:hypothetical protein
MTKITAEDIEYMRAVLAPSWLSGLVVVLSGLIVTAGAIITFSLNNSAFKQDLIGWEQSHTNTGLSVTGQSLQPVNPTLANSWPLILVWAVVGLVTYIIAAAIVRFILETVQVRRQLDYVHANPRLMVEYIIEHLVMRLIAALLLVTLVMLFVYHTLPYVISASRTSVNYSWSLNGARYAAISFILTALCTYAGSILLRLTLGQKRVFERS